MAQSEALSDYGKLLLENKEFITNSVNPPQYPHLSHDAKMKLKNLDSLGLRCLSAIAQLSRVIEDMETTCNMIRRYPWGDTKISKLQHLELSWFLFQNLCYKFSEKVKLYYNTSMKTATALGLKKPEWLQMELKGINREFQREIRDRGNSVHSWDVKNPDLEMLSFSTFFSTIEEREQLNDLPELLSDVKFNYRASKFTLTSRANSVIKFSEAILASILNTHVPTPHDILSQIQAVKASVNRSAV